MQASENLLEDIFVVDILLNLLNKVTLWMPLTVTLQTESLISGIHYHAILLALQQPPGSYHGWKNTIFLSGGQSLLFTV